MAKGMNAVLDLNNILGYASSSVKNWVREGQLLEPIWDESNGFLEFETLRDLICQEITGLGCLHLRELNRCLGL